MQGGVDQTATSNLSALTILVQVVAFAKMGSACVEQATLDTLATSPFSPVSTDVAPMDHAALQTVFQHAVAMMAGQVRNVMLPNCSVATIAMAMEHVWTVSAPAAHLSKAAPVKGLATWSQVKTLRNPDPKLLFCWGCRSPAQVRS